MIKVDQKMNQVIDAGGKTDRSRNTTTLIECVSGD